jgi:hypothetical protein
LGGSGPGWWWSHCPLTPPELNPVEPLWASLKGLEFVNLAGDTLDEVIAAAERGIHRIRTPTIWPSRSYATAACRCGEHAGSRGR